MPRQSANRAKRDIANDQLEPQVPVQEAESSRADAASGRSSAASSSRKRVPKSPLMAGVVGDASSAVTRSGEDVRRRGWFWHWNNIVTQYAPLIGLKGVGLINSYTVWTDRRENSPHRGYAFPSQQSEADFYGEDRAELITINKILVALDLIEIRKEMVPRTDEKGRRWKVPHNLYRVKDHGDDFQLTSRDVMKVVELAGTDRAVYRYVRRMFSPKFSPIDPQNVWHGILEEVRPTETWQHLAAKTAKDESKASARSKAGHASRRTNETAEAFSSPNNGDNPEPNETVNASDSDSRTVEKGQRRWRDQTSVAQTNTGSTTIDDASNKGLGGIRPGTVAPSNKAHPTSVPQTNRMYYQSLTTTTTESESQKTGSVEAFAPQSVPNQARAEDEAIRFFEESNNRVSTPAERRLLRKLADQFDAAAKSSEQSGWQWVGMAIDDAVAAGSAFVAPKRIREILARWQRDGVPEEHRPEGRAGEARLASESVTSDAIASHRPPETRAEQSPVVGEVGAEPFVPPVFTVEACGLTNRQIWSAVLGDLHSSGAIGPADIATWLRDAAILDVREDGMLLLGVPHQLAQRRATGRYLGSIRQALDRVTGIRFEIEVVLFRTWQAA